MSTLVHWALSWVMSHVLHFKPRIRKDRGRLVASSGLRSQILSLGAWHRKVEADPDRRMIRVSSRAAWFFRSSRMIPFDRVSEVLYSYGDYGSATDWDPHQETDVYTVGLLLEPPEDVPLFRFYGQGGFATDGSWPDWFYWDEVIESRLTGKPNDDLSLRYADLMAAMIGVPIGNPLP